MSEEIDVAGTRLAWRPLSSSDSMEELTRLLHAAYETLARAGLNYTAATQSVDATRRRCASGDCRVAVGEGRIVATVTVRQPSPERECDWFRRPGVVSFEQFAVLPELQGRGLGGRVLDRVEARALASGASEIACDTAEPARHLVDWYARRGYRVVGRERWPGKTYESLVLSKSLRA